MNEQNGHLHLISRMIREIRSIMREIGFDVALGPELESEFYNFDALNIPADHPARDMQDTFWIKSNERKVLRTHTSPVQIRFMEAHAKASIMPPYRIIVPGKVFRNEATDATHEAQFYQIEGLLLDTHTSMAELKGTLEFLYKRLFGPDVNLRFRPSFFPFTEPSVEVDIFFRNKWLEVMGAGLIHPFVIKSAGLDPEKYKGFAFGGGLERLIMIKYDIDDVRSFYTGDLRIINQF